MAGWTKKPWAASTDFWLPAFVNVDQYEGRMDHNAHKRQHDVDLDLETQLIAEHNFDAFRKNGGLTMPSEDEASKETQLIHGDEGHSGSSSGKDGEVDSALSPFHSAAMAFSQKHFRCTSDFTRRDSTAGRTTHMSFPFRDGRYVGETQILSDDGNMVETPPYSHHRSGKEQRKFVNARIGGAAAGPSDSQSRDGGVPHFLRDFDPNTQDYPGQGPAGGWHEVTGQSEDRGWETAVRNLELVVSEPSAGTAVRNRDNGGFNADLSYSGEAQLSQNANPRMSTRASNLFCKQDLNKSPEPEFMMDGWEVETRADLGIGRIDEGGSNVDLLHVVEQVVLQSTPLETKVSELEGKSIGVPFIARTGGSIRTASLRASALQASSCSSSGRYRHSTPQGSKSDEVQNVEREATTTEMPMDVPQKAGGSSGDTTAMSMVTVERGHSAVSFPSVLSYGIKGKDSPRIVENNEAVKAMGSADAEVGELSKVGTSMQGEASSVLAVEVSRPVSDKSPSSARKLILPGNELEKCIQTSNVDRAEAQSQPSSDHRKDDDAEPLPSRENHSSPLKSPYEKSLERRSSFGSGLFSTGSDMSYLSTQSPGEDSQARALNMVDKLVWLNNIGLPQELQLEEEKAPRGPSTNAKSILQSRVQVAEAKAGMDDPFGVFDWVDSQDDPFGGGAATATSNKGVSKVSSDVGQHSKQSVFGSRKGGVAEVPGNRNRKAEKLPDKAKFLKPIPLIEKHKGMPKNISGGIEVKCEQQRPGRRHGNGFGAMDITQEPGATEPAAIVVSDAHQARVGSAATDKLSGVFEEGVSKFGAMGNISTTDEVRFLSTVKVPPPRPETINNLLAEQASVERSSNDAAWPEPNIKESIEASKYSSKVPDVQQETGERTKGKQVGDLESSRPNGDRPPSPNQKSIVSNDAPQGNAVAEGVLGSDHRAPQVSIVSERAIGSDHCVLQEASSPDKVEAGGLMQQYIGDLNLSHHAAGNIEVKMTDNTAERMPVTLEQAGRSPTLQKDGSGDLALNDGGALVDKLSAVSPDQSTESDQNGKVLDNANDLESSQVSDPQQQSYGDDLEMSGPFEVVENSDESSKPTVDRTKLEPLEPIIDRDHSRLSGHLEGTSLASVSLSSREQTEGRGFSPRLSTQDVSTGAGTIEAKIEQTTLSERSSSPSAEVDKVSFEDEEKENTASVSISLRNEGEDERKPKIEDEIQSPPPKKATRRGRSQSRFCTKLVANGDPASGSNSFVTREKGRGRRVTWAGPLLEHVRQHTSEVRRPRSPKEEIEARNEDIAESSHDAADSSGEETEDLIDDAPASENGTAKGNSEGLEVSSRYNDLDKIKRRFNMSDAAVARLLGTDEDEDPDLINEEGTGVKVRSLSHIHPEANGNGDEVTIPNFRRVSKGLRSVRSRSEEGVRRPWPFASCDQGRFNREEVVSPQDRNALPQGNVNGSVMGDGHPSDNEFMNGTRRMRSIADVSFSNLPQATPGRPPLARGLRRKRGRHVVISPPEATDPSDDDLPPSVPPSILPIIGKLRGKGGPRSARKRKEIDPDAMPSTSEVSISPNSSKEASPTGFKRRKRTGAISVLLSHGLNEDIIKHQKKIVAKLGGRVATSASECSHFVADKFVRTGNMLEAMASGKPVVNIEWLETCSEANRFIDEEDFILQDARKEEEMGFSMMSTIAAARQRPLFQGIRVYITPGTSPGPDSLSRIVKSAGGQVVNEYHGPPADGDQESNFCVVISSEEEFEDCIPFLEQGAKVYTPELILSAVTSYHLDFSNDQLFKNFTIRRRRGSSSRRTM